MTQFQLLRIYVAYSLVELPEGAATFNQLQDVQSQFDLNIQHQALGEHQYEVSLTGMVFIKPKATAESAERYLAKLQVKQAGIFSLPLNLSDEQQRRLLRIDCAYLLFPYLRERMAELSVQATIPLITLLPLDLASLAQEEQAQAKIAAEQVIDKTA